MEKNNIFEGAKFGDKFLTNFGCEAVLISKNKNGYILAVANYPKEISNKLCSQCYIYDELGRRNGCDYLDEYKIVSKYHEDIDEDKLDELARKYILTMSGMMGFYNAPSKVPEDLETCIDIFKTAYRKAKEEE